MTTAVIMHSLVPTDGSRARAYDGSVEVLPEGVSRRRNYESEAFTIDLVDGRALQDEPSLDREGFTLAREFHSSLDLEHGGLDSDAIVDTYYPEVSALVVAALGGVSKVRRAIVFDHTIRSRARRARGERESNGENVGGYASGAHNDNSEASARTRVRLLAKSKAEGGSVTLPAPPLEAPEAERLANSHFGIFNVWRHFRSDCPVRDYPLAVLDATSAAEDDFRTVEYVYPDRVGEVVYLVHQPRHRWVYYDEMCHHEALIFKVFDSASATGLKSREECPPNTAHASFRLSGSDENTPPRESIECRVLVEFVD